MREGRHDYLFLRELAPVTNPGLKAVGSKLRVGASSKCIAGTPDEKKPRTIGEAKFCASQVAPEGLPVSLTQHGFGG